MSEEALKIAEERTEAKVKGKRERYTDYKNARNTKGNSPAWREVKTDKTYLQEKNEEHIITYLWTNVKTIFHLLIIINDNWLP